MLHSLRFPAHRCTRRRLLGGLAAGAAWLHVPGAFAEELVRTPRLTEGPFYPDRLPLDTDNDLLIIDDSITPAVGQVTHLSGRVLDAGGRPVRNARVEIWQVDAHGAYLHSGSMNAERRDRHFQGFGRFETASDGGYRFRTVRPVAYGNRTPHIHFAIEPPRGRRFVTQMHIEGEPTNATDGVLNRIRDPRRRAAVIVPLEPVADSPAGELAAVFDIVLDFNAEAS